MKTKIILMLIVIALMAAFLSPRWGIVGCYRDDNDFSASRHFWESGAHVPYHTLYGWKRSIFYMLFISELHLWNELTTCEGL